MAIDTFSRQEFEARVVEELPAQFTRSEDFYEYFYETTLSEDVKLKLRSTVDTRDDTVRPDGSDSIKIRFVTNDKYENTVALDGDYYKTIKRTPGWDRRVRERTTALLDAFPDCIQWCVDCDGVMVFRNGFLGCSNWSPNGGCQHTEDI